MSNVYLNPIEQNCHSENVDFPSLKNSSSGKVLVSSNSRRYRWILKFLNKQKSKP